MRSFHVGSGDERVGILVSVRYESSLKAEGCECQWPESTSL